MSGKPKQQAPNASGKQKQNQNQNPSQNCNYDGKTGRQPRGRTRFGNDFDWYNRIKGAIKPAGQIGFGYPVGLAKADYVGPAVQGNLAAAAYQDYVKTPYSGIMAFDYLPVIGKATKPTDPVNMAAQQLYTFVRYHNSGARNYESSDLIMYLLAMDSLYQWYFCGVRALSVLTTYQFSNRYLAKTLVTALGFNYESLVENYNDFKGYLNILATRLNQFCLPKSFSITERHAWLATNIFKDSQVEKSQLYLFKPSHLYKFSGFSSETGTELIPQEVPSSLTYGIYVQFAENLLAPMLETEDVGIMSGDTLKAFGSGSLVRLDPIDSSLTASIVYDKSVLTQIHNAVICTGYDPVNIKQTNNTIKQVFKFNTAAVSVVGNVPLDMPFDVPTVEEVIEATRLSLVIAATEDAENGYPASYGTELVRGATVYTISNHTGQRLNGKLYLSTWNSDTFDLSQNITVPAKESIELMLSKHAVISQFNQHPRFGFSSTFIFSAPGSNTEQSNAYQEFWDIENCVYISYSDLQAMNNAAVMSQFYLTEMDSTMSSVVK